MNDLNFGNSVYKHSQNWLPNNMHSLVEQQSKSMEEGLPVEIIMSNMIYTEMQLFRHPRVLRTEPRHNQATQVAGSPSTSTEARDHIHTGM